MYMYIYMYEYIYIYVPRHTCVKICASPTFEAFMHLVDRDTLREAQPQTAIEKERHCHKQQ